MRNEKALSDLRVSRKLVNIAEKCKKENIPFNITFAQLRRLMSIRECQYQKILLDEKRARGDKITQEDRKKIQLNHQIKEFLF